MTMVSPGDIIGVQTEKGNVAYAPFYKGESFTYDVMYQKVRLGKSVLTFHGEMTLGDQKAYYITFRTKVPSLNDAEDLYADKHTFLPIEVHRSIKKKIGFDDRIVERYDQKNFRVYITQKSKLRSRDFTIQKESLIHNAILLAYYYRAQSDFDRNDVMAINLPMAEFDIIYDGVETIDTPLGEYKAHVFTSDPEKFKLWLSADERKIPLKIENPGTFGYSLVIKSLDRG
ncbi:MAG: DUF3108 domain-containing protein [Candidatus Omnitrophica bacterium]|nr:DUF3108 domain-containing protein [Candidatus Omnitrophota bacterium]